MAFFHSLRSHGSAPALIDPSGAFVTYDALADHSDLWRARFEEHAARLASRLLIGIELAPTPAMIAAYLGALAGGHAVLLGAPGDLAAGAVIAQRYRPNLTLAAKGAAVGVIAGADDPALPHPDLRLLLSTSGSTGDPKLVRLSEDNVQANAASIVDYLRLGPTDRGMTTLPLHYSYGLSVLHSHLEAGAGLILTDTGVTDAAFDHLCRTARVTNLAFVPHQLNLLDARGADLSGLPDLRFVTQAGGRLGAQKVRAWAQTGQANGWDFIVMYGQTEAAPRMAWLPPGHAMTAPDTIGQAIPGGRFRIEDENGAPITAPGRSGELVYDGANVMLGYAEARGDLALGRTVTSLRTGDIAEWSEDGFVRLIGRTKRFVKLYGLRLGLDRIEAMIEAAGLEGRAVAPADRLVVLTSAADQTEAISRLVAEECGLPRQDVTVHAIPAYPLLPSGKIDYAALTRLAQDLPFAAPPTRTNPQSLGAEFAAATRRRTVRPEDTFAGLGGDSLAHLHLTLAIEDRLGHVPADWDRMTVAALDRLARDRDTSATPQKLQPIDPAVLARLIAMTCVVLFHLNQWPIMGGTWLLVLLTGYSLARFQRDTMVRGEAMAVLCNLLVPLLPCYYLLIVGYSLLPRDVPVEMFLLLANGPHAASGTALIAPYWFISLYAQIALAAAGLSLLPLARRAIRRDPFVAGLAVSLITTGIVGALRAIVHNCTGDACEEVIRAYPMTERSLLFCLPFLGLGWAIQSARDNWQRIQVIIALILAIIVFPIHTNGFLTIVAVGAGLLLLPVTISIPARLVRTSRRLATATLFVYLGHTAVIWLFKTATNLHAILGPVVAGILVLSISFALGLAIEIAYRRGEALVLGVTARRKTARHPLY